MTIIRNRADVASATDADLVETYNAFTGQSVEEFESRAAAEHKTSNAIMGAEDAANHRGVGKGQLPIPLTLEEVAALGLDGAQEATESEVGAVAPTEGENPFKPGTMAHQLWVATKSVDNNKPRIKKAKDKSAPSKPRRTDLVLAATNSGVSKIQANSKRAAVLAMIQQAPEATLALSALDAAMGEKCRGYVQKLIEMKHLVVVE